MIKQYSKQHYIITYNDLLQEYNNFWRTKAQKKTILKEIKKVETILKKEYKLKNWEF